MSMNNLAIEGNYTLIANLVNRETLVHSSIGFNLGS